MIKKFTLAALAAIFASNISSAQTTVTVGNTTLDVRTVIQGTNSSNGIDIPWEIQWGPDDYIWMTERYGRVSRLNPETGARTTILDLTSTVYDQSEAGLLGLQLHPDFENNPYVYLAYTYQSSGTKERIVRYTYDTQTEMLGTPMTLVDNIVGYSTHIGCRLLILPDNTMIATTGDVHQENTLVQNTSTLNGKVLRMNLDGTIPADNPFGSSNYVYSYGHRNAQGLVLHPNGKLYSSEHGPSTNDEFNIIVPGGNYGWPEVEGFCNQGWETTWCNANTNEEPIAIWHENSTIAPSDLIYYDHPAIPEWQGKMLMTVLKNKHLKEIEVDGVDGTTVTDETIWFQNTFQRLRDILVAPDGRIFLATSGTSWSNTNPFSHSIVELKNSSYNPTGINDSPTVLRTRVQPNPTNGDVRFVFPAELISGNFTITDLAGKMMYSGIIQTSKTQIDVTNLASGLYMLSAVKGNHLSTERLVITE